MLGPKPLRVDAPRRRPFFLMLLNATTRHAEVHLTVNENDNIGVIGYVEPRGVREFEMVAEIYDSELSVNDAITKDNLLLKNDVNASFTEILEPHVRRLQDMAASCVSLRLCSEEDADRLALPELLKNQLKKLVNTTNTIRNGKLVFT